MNILYSRAAPGSSPPNIRTRPRQEFEALTRGLIWPGNSPVAGRHGHSHARSPRPASAAPIATLIRPSCLAVWTPSHAGSPRDTHGSAQAIRLSSSFVSYAPPRNHPWGLCVTVQTRSDVASHVGSFMVVSLSVRPGLGPHQLRGLLYAAVSRRDALPGARALCWPPPCLPSQSPRQGPVSDRKSRRNPFKTSRLPQGSRALVRGVRHGRGGSALSQAH